MNKAAKTKPAAARPDYTRSAQDRFLTQMAQERRKVVIFLTNGVKLEGEIRSFDEYAILLEGEMTDHVYKHAVSTIQPLAGAVSKPDVNVREHKPRIDARREADVAKTAETHASDAEVAGKAAGPRQPVIVIRPKRRLIKTVNNED